MNLKHLEYFISVAEYLSFTKAAEHHYISQTAISYQITSLETELGLLLFHRNKRAVHLTTAGEVFYKEAKQIMESLDKAVSKARGANSNCQGNLTIGFNSYIGKENLPFWIQAFLSSYPNINLNLIKHDTNDLQDVLHTDDIDILFCLSHDFSPSSKLSWKNIYPVDFDPLCVVVHCDHPLASKPVIHRSDLVNEPLVFWDEKSNPRGYDFIVKDAKKTGFLPTLVTTASSAEALLLLVESKRGFTILPRCFQAKANASVRFIELDCENANNASLIAIWRSANSNPTIPMFLDIIDKNPIRSNH
ncbi:MAG: transcriptional regulator, LysR family [Firmicutes bacterium]|nr:transcriptional regulator, LysR family [Bacillota bacterium]